MIETYSLNTRFILTGNYPERLIEPLRSRLEDYNLKPPSKKSVALHLDTILKEENIKFDIKDVAQVINTFYPDIRRTINNVQKYIVKDEFVLPKTLTNSLDAENNIIAELAKKSSKSFNVIRQIVADNNITDFESLYKKLYEEVDKYTSSAGLATIHINEHIFQSTSVVDKEICFMACTAKILAL